MATDNNKPESKIILMDMPEVKDIPGQENIHPPHLKEMADTTISSAGEEGEGILDVLDDDNQEDDELLMDDESNVSPEEKSLLRRTGRAENDETEDISRMKLDQTDEDAEQLNESGEPLDFGEDLDVPGADLDYDNEELGEEDEENNSYSNPD